MIISSNSIKYIDLLYEKFMQEYGDLFNKSENVVAKCNESINSYFEWFNNKFYDITISTLMSISESEMKLVRMRYGLYDNGVYQTNTAIIGKYPEITKKEIQDAYDHLNDRVLYDLFRKLSYIISQFERGNKDVEIKELVGISELGIDLKPFNCLRRSEGPYVLQEFMGTRLRDLYAIKGIGVRDFCQIVNKILPYACDNLSEEDIVFFEKIYRDLKGEKDGRFKK